MSVWKFLKYCWQVFKGSYWMPREGPWDWCCNYHRGLHEKDFFFGTAVKHITEDGQIRRVAPEDFYNGVQFDKVWVDEWREIEESAFNHLKDEAVNNTSGFFKAAPGEPFGRGLGR